MDLFPEEMCAKSLFNSTSLVCAQVPPAQQAAVETLFEDVKRCSGDGHCAEAVLLSCYMRFLIFVYANVLENSPAPNGVLQKAVEYINLNIAVDITLNDVCSAVNMSKYHFCRKFKQATGLTVMEYVLKTRILCAQNMLRNTQLSVEEISEKCGFNCISYFCRVFKKEENCTPLQYRKRKLT